MNRNRTAIQPVSIHSEAHIQDLTIYESRKGRGQKTRPDSALVDSKDTFMASLKRAAKADAKDLEIARYLDLGIALVDLHCHSFFRQISMSQAHRKFSRAFTNQTGGVVSAIMGLSDAGSKATGGVSALFSFFDASIESYDSAFLVSPDLPIVQKLVFQTQGQLAAELTDSKNSTNYSFPQAERALALYASNCTFNGIRALLNSSLATTQTSVEIIGDVVTGVKTNTSAQKTPLLEGDVYIVNKDERLVRQP